MPGCWIVEFDAILRLAIHAAVDNIDCVRPPEMTMPWPAADEELGDEELQVLENRGRVWVHKLRGDEHRAHGHAFGDVLQPWGVPAARPPPRRVPCRRGA